MQKDVCHHVLKGFSCNAWSFCKPLEERKVLEVYAFTGWQLSAFSIQNNMN